MRESVVYTRRCGINYHACNCRKKVNIASVMPYYFPLFGLSFRGSSDCLPEDFKVGNGKHNYPHSCSSLGEQTSYLAGKISIEMQNGMQLHVCIEVDNSTNNNKKCPLEILPVFDVSCGVAW